MSSQNTPESRTRGINRNDSKNPHTTCHGITSSGRPCRRSIAAMVAGLDSSDEESSVVAVIDDDDNGTHITALYCWQHKDQAEAETLKRKNTKVVRLNHKDSLETVFQQMGLQPSEIGSVIGSMKQKSKPTINIQERSARAARAPPSTLQADRTARESHRWRHDMHEPEEGFLSEPKVTVEDQSRRMRPAAPEKQLSSENSVQLKHGRRREHGASRGRPPKKPTSLLSLLCHCGSTEPDLEPARSARPSRTHASAVHGLYGDRRIPKRPSEQISKRASMPQPSSGNSNAKLDNRHRRSRSNDSSTSVEDNKTQIRYPVVRKPVGGRTDEALFPPDLLIPIRPPLAHAQTQPDNRKLSVGRPSNSRTESAPEDGSHIAVNATSTAISMIPSGASVKTASDFLAEMAKVKPEDRSGYIYIYWLTEAHKPTPSIAAESLMLDSPRRASAAATSPLPPDGSRHMLLKVGRTDNVHRRLSEWEKQCGYKPLLIRCYPRPEEGAKVPHVRVVERLVHLELASKNVRWTCSACDREHREWFEVEGRRGVREVGAIVEKWVAWGERQNGR